MTRVCSNCKIEKSLDDFHNHKRLKLGKAYTCKPCVVGYIKAYAATPRGRDVAKAAKKKYEKSPHGRKARLALQRLPKHKARASARSKVRRATVAGRYAEFDLLLRYNYGIDLEDWARMFNAQNGKCAACARRLAFDRTTHVDHHHGTGKIRGLLCQGCNIAIGGAKDDPHVLRRIAIYLEAS